MLDRFLSALVALSLAFLVWLYARSRDQEILDNVPIPVQIALAPAQAGQYALEVSGPPQVTVSFTGPPARIRELRGHLQRGEVRVERTVAVPEDRQNESRYSDTVLVEAADLHAPPGVTPVIVEGRNRIPVVLHRLVERRLRVRFDHALEERIGAVTLEPDTVRVRGPQEVLDRVRTISTQPYALPSRSEAGSASESMVVGPVPLAQEIDGRPVRVTPAAVTVRLTVQPRLKPYELTEVPVQFLCPPNFPLRPKFIGDGRAGKITVRVVGPVADEPPAVLAFIDLTRGKFQAGLHEEPLRLQLPRDYQLAQNPPRSVAFELQPTDLTSPRGLGVAHGP
jgi:hypothetical protein